jgi:hypothetical protein
MTDLLERELYKLDFEIPDGLVDRAVAGTMRAPDRAPVARQIRIATRTTVGRAAALVVAILFVNLVAAYFAPRYGQALADAPFMGGVTSPVLRFSGLDGSQITHLDVSASSSGHTIKVVGAYADTERTVLLLEVDGKPHDLPTKQAVCCYPEGTLVDQFAFEYQHIYSHDAMAMTFAPLAGPASRLGARLKLHITELFGLRPEFHPVSGDWTLNLTLIQQAGKMLAVPDPVTANGITYTLRSVHLSGMQLHIDFSLSGPPVEAQRKLVYETKSPQFPDDGPFARQLVTPRLVGPQGSPIDPYEWGFTLPRQGPITGGMTTVVDGPGHYTLTFGSAPGSPVFQIDIP